MKKHVTYSCPACDGTNFYIRVRHVSLYIECKGGVPPEMITTDVLSIDEFSGQTKAEYMVCCYECEYEGKMPMWIWQYAKNLDPCESK